MLTEKMVTMLNEQIRDEQYSSQLYTQMAAWCAHRGFEGSATFLHSQAKEELSHMYKLFHYVSEAGALPILAKIEAPPSRFENLDQIFRQTLEHEKSITKSISSLAWEAFHSKDLATFQFLQWFIAEQHEEEHLFQSILDKLNHMGIDGRGTYFFDKEIGQLAKSRGN